VIILLKLELLYNEGVMIARLKGNLDRKNSYKINNYLNPLLQKHKIKYLVYNFDCLKDVDNTGVDAILRSKYIMKENKGLIRVCNAKDKMLEVCKKKRLVRINDENELLEMI